jgi:hypothetical protein
VKIEDILSGITDIANRAYADAPPSDRLAFECGMLSSKLREMARRRLYETNSQRSGESTKGFWACFKDRYKPAFQKSVR